VLELWNTYMPILNGTDNDDVIYGNVNTGLSLNNGATDQYAEISNFTDMPTSALTIELTMTGPPPAHSQSLLSYAVAGSNNELLFWHNASTGNFNVYINGAAIDTGISSSTFLNDQPHQLSVSWDSATGAIEVYVDGAVQFSGTHQTGAAIDSGGTLNFGQEQDSVGGNYDANQIFEGVLNEVRIFNDVRTPTEIADGANHQLSDPTTEPGLVANWQMDTTGNTGVTDASGNGNDLTLNNGAEVVPLTDATGDDVINGGAGNDEIHGLSGNDTIHGNDGNDTLYGEENNDTIYGDGGSDLIDGGSGDDVLYGDRNPALSLNNGATDQYAEIANLTDMPTDAFTIEMMLTGSEPGHSQSLFSYATDPGNSHNEVLFWHNASTGNLEVHINTVGYGTGIPVSSFLDGTPHQLSVSWDSASGAIEVYVDGEPVHSGTTQAGNPITSGGTLILGQEQDSVGGNFDPAQIFEGSYEDVRIFNDVRTAAEIYDNSNHELASPTTEAGLIANWQFNDIGAASAVDASGNGNDMTLVNGAAITDLTTTPGNDTIHGGAGNDEIYGDAGDDVLFGDAGDDVISGGAGNDTITGGTGADTLTGGDGRDTFHVDAGDTVDGGTGGDDYDTLDLSATGTHRIVGQTTDADGDSTSGTVEFLDGAGNVTGSMTFTEIENIICFASGTFIQTPRGDVPVEDLQIGDLVITMDNGLQPVRWVGKRTVSGRGRFAPIRFAAGSVHNDRDLFVSPQHRMLVSGSAPNLYFGRNEVLAAAAHLVNGTTIKSVQRDFVTWYHILFDHHEVIYANGTTSESYHPGATGLDGIDAESREELFALFPELRTNPNGYGMSARTILKRHEARLMVLPQSFLRSETG